MRRMNLAILGILFSSGVYAAPIFPGNDDYDTLQEALIEVEEGGVVELGEGTFRLEDALSLDVDGVTIRGQGHDKTILSFKGQQGGGEGLLVTSDNVVLEGFAVEDTDGDAVKAKGSYGITFRGVRAEWTNGPDENNGAYGLYPVESRNVLIENCIARGASDAGIYVGQSQDIIVRGSTAMENVAGIEIENSYRAEVYDNLATHNTGGILVFDLPGLMQMGGHDVRVFNNKVIDNDTKNFAPEGNIVGTVPTGTGVMIMANKNVEVFENEISGNGSAGVLIVSYPFDYDDNTYYPHPRTVHVHNNVFSNIGNDPDGDIGAMLVEFAGTPIPEIVWDGVMPIWHRLAGQPDEDRISAHGNVMADGSPATFLQADAMLAMTIPFLRREERTTKDYGEPLPPVDPVEMDTGE